MLFIVTKEKFKSQKIGIELSQNVQNSSNRFSEVVPSSVWLPGWDTSRVEEMLRGSMRGQRRRGEVAAKDLKELHLPWPTCHDGVEQQSELVSLGWR